MRRTLVTALAVTALAVPLGLVSAAGTAAAATPVPPRVPATDFNHDGYQDLVLGAPGATVSGKENAGAVSVVYGGKNGPDIAHAKVLTRSTTGIPGAAEEGGYFGERVTSGDLDGDSYTDLVVAGLGGAPSVVLWGSAAGLSGQGSVALPTSTGMFAVGDFNGDGHRDLVTDDYPRSDDPDDDAAGMTISYGPFDRASGKPASQDSIATSQTFGPADIVVGDMTGDGADDIVTSHGFEESAYASKFWKGGKSGVSHTAKSLTSSFRGTVGDVDGDGYGDLVVHDIGDNYEDIPYEKGTVLVMYGTADGPSTTRTKTITQDTAGVPGVGESGDMFGTDLSAGDVNGDGYADIAVGVPGEAIGTIKGAGSVVLLKGGRGGLSGTGSQAFNQSTTAVPGASEKGDGFGQKVLLSDLNGDGKADLTATAPLEDGTYTDSGAAWVLRGATGGLTTSGITSFGAAAVHVPEKNAQLGQDLIGH